MAKNTNSEPEYENKMGMWLIENARDAGNLMSKFRYYYDLDKKTINRWLGRAENGEGRIEHFCKKHEMAMEMRKDHYFDLVKRYKMDKTVFASIMWSEFGEIINPPKESTVSSKSEINMSVDDDTLNHIIETLRKDCSTGFN